MKRLSDILEANVSPISQEAMNKGLKYRGFGHWADPVTGKITYKSAGDRLEKIDGKPDDNAANFDEPGIDQLANQGTEEGGGVPPGSNVGPAPEPGLEYAPQDDEDMDWKPGPDGDNCVDDEAPPEDIPPDTYVGRSNSSNWVAGPDGSNLKNTSVDSFISEVVSLIEEIGPETKAANNQRNAKIVRNGLKPNTADISKDVGAKTSAEINNLRSFKKDLEKDLRGGITAPPKPKVVTPEIVSPNDAKIKDMEKLRKANEELRGMSTDSNYDLFDVGRELGSGSYGTVYESKDGKAVIKKGQIGRNELKILSKLRDNPHTPNFIHGEFDKLFPGQSSHDNNPRGTKVPNTQGKYRSVDEDEDYASGRFAMSKVPGRTLANLVDSFDIDPKDESLQKAFWKARAKLHKAGVSHNDMHSDNIFYDPDTGQFNFVDMGLAQDDPISALMEATAGLSTGYGDYQLSPHMRRDRANPTLAGIMNNNMNALEDKLTEIGIDRDIMNRILNGDIRIGQHYRNSIRSALEYAGLDPMELLKNLYTEIDDDDGDGIPNTLDPDYKGPKVKNPQNVDKLRARINNAIDNQSVLKRANMVRKNRGTKPLNLRAIVTKAFDHDD